MLETFSNLLAIGAHLANHFPEFPALSTETRLEPPTRRRDETRENGIGQRSRVAVSVTNKDAVDTRHEGSTIDAGNRARFLVCLWKTVDFISGIPAHHHLLNF
ncbi:hypothetical protein Pcinc_029085 [Petrolisthes cinctipes]|uniref:Uncharacterized protein n=1 Tax=Petrolisthes cinctipes TaxID=88211 RepID=A0AAE1F2D4_PETCI|nr:hypothetical protein Pcinc_029085 [Petrolisthes cinctipes]